MRRSSWHSGAESLTFIATEQTSPDAAKGEDTAGKDAHIAHHASEADRGWLEDALAERAIPGAVRGATLGRSAAATTPMLKMALPLPPPPLRRLRESTTSAIAVRCRPAFVAAPAHAERAE